MKRSPMPPRKAWIKRKTELKRVNRPRLALRRALAFGEQAKLCRQLPCAIASCRDGPIHAAHVLSRGAGGRDEHCAPLCRHHHEEQHRVGIVTFQRSHDVDLSCFAADLHAFLVGGRKLADLSRALQRVVLAPCGGPR